MVKSTKEVSALNLRKTPIFYLSMNIIHMILSHEFFVFFIYVFILILLLF